MQNEGFRWLRWDVTRASIDPISEIRAIRALTRLYGSEAFAGVHHFTVKPNLYGTIAARRVGIGVIVNTFTGLGFLYSDNTKARAVRTMLAPVMRMTFASSRVTTVFQNTSDMKAMRRLVPADRSQLIAGTGVDIEKFKPRVTRDDSAPVVLMAARLIKEKGVADLVEAGRMLKRQGTRVRFVIAGEPDPGNPSSVSAGELKRWRRQDLVEIIGHRDDMAEVIPKADIAVLPTYYPEGVPRFLLEAAACGLPLVATETPGCVDVIEDGVNGFLVPPRDPAALADALAKLIHSSDLRTQFGERSRAIAVTKYDETQIVGQYLDLYRDLGLVREAG